MLIAVHATRPRPLCSRVGHSVAFAACLPPIEHLWDLGSLPPIEHLWDLGILIWRAALMARTLSICLAMDASSAEQHPSRKAAFLPCASRPPDFRPLKTRSGHARQRARWNCRWHPTTAGPMDDCCALLLAALARAGRTGAHSSVPTPS